MTVRLLVLVLAGLVFGAFWIFDPVALTQLGASCALGHCGISSRILLAIAGGIVAAALVLRAIRRHRAPPAKRPLPVIIMPKQAKPLRDITTPPKPRKPRAAKATQASQASASASARTRRKPR